MNYMQIKQENKQSGWLRQRMHRALLGWIVLWMGVALPAIAATPDIDIRVLSPITTSQQAASYGLSVSDCSQVKSVKVGAGSDIVTMDSSLAQAIVGTPDCVYPFTANSLSPQAHITLLDGTQSTYSENFQVSTQPPSLNFRGVNIEEDSNGQQILATCLNALTRPSGTLSRETGEGKVCLLPFHGRRWRVSAG